MGSTDRKNKGQSLVEFMFVALILMTLLLGIAEVSRFFMTWNVLTGAAREAVRNYAAEGDLARAQNIARDILLSAGINGAPPVDLVVGIDNMVTATQRYTFRVAVPGFLPPVWDADYPLWSATSMRKEFTP